MASLIINHMPLFFLIIISISLVNASSNPKALILPLSKDDSADTTQYVTNFNMGTPPARKNFVVDLGGKHLWMDCDNGSYLSTTIKHPRCGSAACSVVNAPCTGGCVSGHHKSGCSNETCYITAENTIPAQGSGFDVGFVSLDKVSIQSSTISNFIFGCLDTRERLGNLAKGSDGVVGLGREKIALPSQLSSSFGGSFRRKFAICLPSSSKSNGVMFFGDSPYIFYPGYNTSKSIDVSSRFQHTKLYINTMYTGSSYVIRGPPSPEYFIKVSSILVNKKPIPINSTFLQFHRNGKGGAKISTVNPYTELETSIYKSLVKVFDEDIAAWNVTKVASPVEPFTDCYTMGRVGMSGLGISVPDIAFEFENKKDLSWEMYGANTVVQVNKDVVCLAFVDAGEELVVTTPIVIGAYQLQDNLLEFDVASNRLGFTSTLLWEEIECSNFKF